MLSPKKNETGLIPKWGMYLFPFLTLVFALFYLLNEDFYRNLIREDSIVEWLTFAFLFAAGSISLAVALKIRSKHQYWHWFFIVFGLFNLLAGLEEISWGQRVFEVETTGVFHEYSDQNEINLHNTFQGITRIKTKHIALLVLFIYGVVLPGVFHKRARKSPKILAGQIVMPPLFLRLGFVIASIMMLDFQTGHEEEIGEFFFSICFFIMMLWNLKLVKEGYFSPDNYSNSSNNKPSFSE